MEIKSRTRSGQTSGIGKGPLMRNLRSKSNSQLAAATNTRSPARARPAEPLYPAASSSGLARSRRRDPEESSYSSDEIASEIIVRTDGMDDAMEFDTSTPESASPSPGPDPEPEPVLSPEPIQYVVPF
jgi:hypothetical protein